jgi:hypothetical protein
VTEVEAEGYRLAGNAPDDGIASQISIILATGGMSPEMVKYMTGKLTEAALSARKKITEATRFEIRVLTPPKPSTLLKPKPKKTAKKKAPKASAKSPKTKPQKGV